MAIALLTDFGGSDAYVGTLKGVIHSINPKVPILDIAHEIPAFDRVHAGLLLFQAYRYFPKKTIFVTVVDPGVGTKRKPLLVQTRDYFFVGPDNGLFTLALENQRIRKIVHLTNEKYFLHPVSRTFHGRDIFSPVAAHLSKGVSPARLGKEVGSYRKLPEFLPEIRKREIVGRILSIDRFGSALTNLRRDFLKKFFPKLNFKVFVGAGLVPARRARGQGQALPLRGIHTHYAEGRSGQALLLFSSAELLEICANRGSAAQILRLKKGDLLRIPLKR